MTTPAPTAGGGEFVLDVEKADVAVNALKKVHAELLELRREAFNLARPAESGRDAVSAEAFDVLAAKAVGPGSFAEAMTGGLEHVQSLIDSMEADISQHRELDESAGRTSRGS